MGDLNYNGILDENDTAILNEARNGNRILSNLQEYLATDMDIQEDDYTINFEYSEPWIEDGNVCKNVKVIVTNNGTTPIRNWAFRCNDYCGTPNVLSAWNAVFCDNNIIKNNGYNSDIAVGGTVEFGYKITNPTNENPVFTICTYRSIMNEGYSVSFNSYPTDSNNFLGYITITNTTDEPIMAWELTFTADNFENIESNQFIKVSSIGNTYTIAGTYNGNIPIPANSSITMQFCANKTTYTDPSISNISLTEMVY